MNRIAQSIKNRLSLRPPQADSLNILAELTDKLTLKKHTPCPSPEGSKHTPNPPSRGEYKSLLSEGELKSPLLGGDSGVGSFLQQELEKVKTSYPTCTGFERNFPSLCFALATGVGKTRLMGAFISYLYLSEGVRHFFVLAPNLTIYNKLITDFTANTPKYVFKGIGEFASNPPMIITGDNYESGIGGRK